jgi:SAM-dependent methyltransferase
VDGIPILIGPERLIPSTESPTVDVRSRQYAEAYEERDFYDSIAAVGVKQIRESEAFEHLEPVVERGSEYRDTFPDPVSLWLNATYEPVAQELAYGYLAPVREKVVLQVGGTGLHAITLLLAGASHAFLLTPMLEEARFGAMLAAECGVASRFAAVVGVAEEQPFTDATVDRIHSGGCMHHTVTDVAFAEIHRVLAPGGRFSAVDPWKAPLHAIGTKVLGKRDAVYCRPMNPERVRGLSSFAEMAATRHGALTRYPLLALHKAGIAVSLETARRLMRWDDRVAARLPRLRRHGSCVAIMASRAQETPGATGR